MAGRARVGTFSVAVLGLALAGGCAENQDVAAVVQPSPPAQQSDGHPSGVRATPDVAAGVSSETPGMEGQPVVPVPTGGPRDARPLSLSVITLGAYELTLPAGAVSGSREFWKRIDEDGSVFDVATHDLLYKNGVRAGEGSVGDWPRFKEIFDRAGVVVHRATLVAHEAKDQIIPCSDDMPEQRLFYFDSHGLTGKVFDACRNLFSVTFGPAPRKPGAVRIELCPVVHCTRHRYTYTALNEQQVIEFTADEQLIDLNLRADIPAGRFLVVAPSEASENESSIGHQFLTRPRHAGRSEARADLRRRRRPRA